MDFDLSEEQRLLKESVDGLLSRLLRLRCSARNTWRRRAAGAKRVWSKLAEQGLLGLPFSEDDGGFGAGAVETMIVMEALGKALVLEPYLATVVIGGGFLRHGGSAEQKAAHIPGIIDGSKTFAFAQLEKNSRYDLSDVATTAKKKGAGWVIDGEKFVVLNGETADTLIVTARTKGGQRDASGIGVFLVPGECQGRRAERAIRPRTACMPPTSPSPASRSARMPRSAIPRTALPLIERVVDDARTAMCAEAVGAMDESLKTTVEYLKTRKQFGVPIGSFQTLQHRAADMFVAVEQARSMSMFATMAADFDDAKERATAVAAAKVQIGKSRKVRRPAVDPAPWRHRHDPGGQDRPLLQAADHDREQLLATPTTTCAASPTAAGWFKATRLVIARESGHPDAAAIRIQLVVRRLDRPASSRGA